MLSRAKPSVPGVPVKRVILSAARQGLFFIPVVWILSATLGMLGIQMSQTVADLLTLLCAVPLQLNFMKTMSSSQS